MARCLQSWSDRFTRSIRIQLEVAKEVLHKLEIAHDGRALAPHEEQLQQLVKLISISLASLQRTIARQESRILWLVEGDTSTRFFHAHANVRWRRTHIHSLHHKGQLVVDKDDMAVVAFDFFSEALGSVPTRFNTINLPLLGLHQLNPEGLGDKFMKEEVWTTIHALLPDKAPGLDGFTVRFCQVVWPTI
jgi:hypothetical protein